MSHGLSGSEGLFVPKGADPRLDEVRVTCGDPPSCSGWTARV